MIFLPPGQTISIGQTSGQWQFSNDVTPNKTVEETWAGIPSALGGAGNPLPSEP
jgi:hypothetical protein